MRKLTYKHATFEVDGSYFLPDSFFYSKLHFESNYEGIIDISDIDNVEIEDMMEYLNYLSMGDFIITYGFNKMLQYDQGKTNDQNLPEDFWKIKIQEDLIRDNFYRLKLWTDPHFGLVKINDDIIPKDNLKTIKELMGIVGNRAIIAGGSLLNPFNNGSDIDLFAVGLNEDQAKQLVDDLMSKYGYDMVISEHAITFSFFRIQIILRLYHCMSEVLHGFDLPICAVGYDGKSLYATKGWIHNHKHEISYFDKDRMSRSYFYRLAKWHIRGYKVILPMFNEDRIDKLALVSKITSKTYTIDDVIKSQLKMGGRVIEDKLSSRHFTDEYIMDIIDRFCKDTLSEFFLTGGRAKSTKDIKDKDKKREIIKQNKLRLKDALTQQNVLFMAILWNHIPKVTLENKKMTSDYEGKGIFINRFSYKPTGSKSDHMIMNDKSIFMGLRGNIMQSLMYGDNQKATFNALINNDNQYSREIKKFYESIKWMTHNPMKQLTGSFHPETMQDLQKWFIDSGVYLDNIYKVTLKRNHVEKILKS